MGIPAAVIVFVAALVVRGSETTRRHRRYRPGRPFDFRPIWLLAAPEQVGLALGETPTSERGAHRAIDGPVFERGARLAIGAGATEGSSGARVLVGSTGGASDRW